MSGCGYSEEAYQAEVSKAKKQKALAAKLEKEKSSLEKDKTKLQRDLKNSKNSAAKCEKEKKQWQKNKKKLDSDVKVIQAKNKELETQLQAGQNKSEQLANQVAQLKKEASTQPQQEDVQQESVKLKERNEALKIMVVELRQKVKELNQYASKQKESDEKSQKLKDMLLPTLKQQIDSGQVIVASNPQPLIRLDVRIFESGHTFIKASGFKLLKQVGNVLKQINGKHIQVIGHSDGLSLGKSSRSKFSSNLELSALRAISVVRYLVDEVGIDPSRISAAGYGSQNPIDKNDTEKGRQRNRRIEFVLLPIGT